MVPSKTNVIVSEMVRDRELGDAVKDDAFGYILGPIPKSTTNLLGRRVVAKFFPWMNSASYLKDDPLFLHETYRGESSKLLPFPFHDSNGRLPQVVVLNNAAASKPLTRFVVHKLPPPGYTLSTDIRAMTEESLANLVRYLKFTLRDFNGNNEILRLKDIREAGDSTELVVEGVRYADYARTNLCLDAEKAKGTGTLRQRVHPDAKLEPLSNSLLANALGVAALLFTADGQLVIQRRSRWVAEVPRLLGPSYSGSANYDDVAQTLSLADFPIFREGREELGFKPEAVRSDSVRFLGLTRELRRGGKPEMFFSGQLAMSRDEVERSWNEALHRRETSALVYFPFGRTATETLENPRQQADCIRRVEALVAEHGSTMTLALQTNLALWIQSRLQQAG